MAMAKLAPVDEMTTGEVRVISVEGRPPRNSILLARLSDDHEVDGRPLAVYRAYWNICQHLPIPLDSGTGIAADGDDILCVTHGARYRPNDGYCHSGPCQSERLEPVEIAVDDGWVIAKIS